MSARQSATTSAYRHWFPFGKHSEQAAESKRTRRSLQKPEPGTSAPTKQKSSSRTRESDVPAIPSRGAPSVGTQPPLSRKAQPPNDALRDPSTSVPSSSRYAKSQQQGGLITTATTPTVGTADVVPNPQPRPPKRTRTHADKVAMANNSEQESSAEESIRKLNRTRRAPEAVTLATSPTTLAPQTPVIEQASVAKAGASSSRRDPEREERHRRRREEKVRAERAKEEQAKAEYEARVRATVEAEYAAKLAKAGRPSSSRRDPLQEYDSSDSARRKPRMTSFQSKSRTAQEEIISTTNGRYDSSSYQPVASSGQSAIHVPFGIPKQPTTSSQSTIRERVMTPAPPAAAAGASRSATPPPAPKLFPMHLPLGEQENYNKERARERDKERDGERDRDRDRERHNKDKHRERKEHVPKSSHNRPPKDRSSSLPVNQPNLSGYDPRPSHAEHPRQRGNSHSESIRPNGYVAQEPLRVDTRVTSNPVPTEVAKNHDSYYTKATAPNSAPPRDQGTMPFKVPDRSRGDPTSNSTPYSASAAYYPYTNGHPQVVSIHASQGPPDRAPSRFAQKTPAPNADMLSPTAGYVRSPTSYAYDRPGRHEVPPRSYSTVPEVPTSSYSPRTHPSIVSSPVPPNPPPRSETYPPPALDKPLPMSATAQLLSPLSSIAPQLTPSHSAASNFQQTEYVRSPEVPVSAPPYIHSYGHTRSSPSQLPLPSPGGLSQPILIPRTPSNNSQVQDTSAVLSPVQQQSTADRYISPPTKNTPTPARPVNYQTVSYESQVYAASPAQVPTALSRQEVSVSTQYSHSSARNVQGYPQSTSYYATPQSPLSNPIYVYESVMPSVQSPPPSKTTNLRPPEPRRSTTAPATIHTFTPQTAPVISTRTPSGDKTSKPSGIATNGNDHSHSATSLAEPRAMYQSGFYRPEPADVPPTGRTAMSPGPMSPPPTSRSTPYSTRTVLSPQIPAQSSASIRHPSVLSPAPGHNRSQSHSRSQTQPINIPLARSTSQPQTPASLSAQLVNMNLANRERPTSRRESRDSLPQLTPSTSPDSMDEILLTPSSLAKTIKGSSQPLVAPVPIPVLVSDEPKRKGGILGLFRSASKSAAAPRPHDVWHPPTPGPSQRRDSGERARPVVATKPAPIPLIKVDSRSSGQAKIAKPPPIIIPRSGRTPPPPKAHSSFKLFGNAKRYRTVSSASMEALDGTANNTVVGSPTSSMRTSTPGPMGPPSPPLRDPFSATEEWRNNEEKDFMVRGAARRRRPGVTFDLHVKDDGVSEPIERQRLTRTPRPQADGR